MTYQKITGSLMANSHPGSYCGQDAYNDMFVTEKRNAVCNASNRNVQGVGCGFSNKGTRSQGFNRPNSEGGYDMKTVVRRLTPLECTRLQGFPDGWVDIGEWTDSKGKLHKESDSPKYKALGNSIALPFWEWMAKRMAEYLPEGATMASLFDGIGGFPLVFQRAGIKPIWASEIEEFPIAVTKIRFPEEET